MRILVLGIGNILLEDEGIGVRVIEELQRRFHLPAEVTAMDGGTVGMALLGDLLDKDYLIIVDAVRTEQPPTTVIRLVDAEVPAFFQNTISPHQLGVSELLAALKLAGGGPEHIVLIGVVPESTELSLDLSAAMCQQVDHLVGRVGSELTRLGLDLIPRDQGTDATTARMMRA